jgi:hypothetical protein
MIIDLKISLPIAIALPWKSYLEIIPSIASFSVDDETIHTGLKYSLGVRYGFSLWQKRHAKSNTNI